MYLVGEVGAREYLTMTITSSALKREIPEAQEKPAESLSDFWPGGLRQVPCTRPARDREKKRLLMPPTPLEESLLSIKSAHPRRRG